MNYFLLILGLIITTLAVLDLIYTVLSPSGTGMISGRFTRYAWRLLLFLNGSDGKSRGLTYAGAFILFALILLWVFLIWIGNTLTFYADPESLYNPSRQVYVTDFADTMYYTGYVLSSMGNGDYTPMSTVWKLYVGFISYTGVIYMSLSISFLIPVVEAVTMKRKLAISIAVLGNNPSHIIERNSTYHDVTSLVDKLYDFREDIIKMGENHLTYPIIHYFHSTHKYESLQIYLVALDETLTCLLYSLKDLDDSNKRKLEELRQTLTFYLSTLDHAFIDPKDDEPEIPEMNRHREKLVILEPEEIRQAFHNLGDRRKLLLAYLQNDGWQWADMEKNSEEIKFKMN